MKRSTAATIQIKSSCIIKDALFSYATGALLVHIEDLFLSDVAALGFYPSTEPHQLFHFLEQFGFEWCPKENAFDCIGRAISFLRANVIGIPFSSRYLYAARLRGKRWETAMVQGMLENSDSLERGKFSRVDFSEDQSFSVCILHGGGVADVTSLIENGSLNLLVKNGGF